MELTQILDLMGTLKLYGIRSAYDELMGAGIAKPPITRCHLDGGTRWGWAAWQYCLRRSTQAQLSRVGASGLRYPCDASCAAFSRTMARKAANPAEGLRRPG